MKLAKKYHNTTKRWCIILFRNDNELHHFNVAINHYKYVNDVSDF